MFDAIRQDIEDIPQGQTENKALLFNRLCRGIDNADERGEKEKAMGGLLSGYSPASLALYRQAVKNWQDFLRGQSDILTFHMKVTSPMVVGKGDQNVHEFGITLQTPWGTPVIPGSAIKGVLSSYAHAQGGPDWQKGVLSSFAGQFSLIMFGGQNAGKKNFAGALDFLDAWWLPGPNATPFAEDIVNVHNRTWYQAGDNHAPNNWPDGMDSPVPIPFAVVKPGEEFLFAIRGAGSWRDLAKEMLINAAADHGFGAKTWVGYGRLGYIQSNEDLLLGMAQLDSLGLAQLFKDQKGNTNLGAAFAAEAARRQYTGELHSLFTKYRPALCMLADLQKRPPQKWAEVRQCYDQYANALKKITLKPEDKEVQEIFQLCLPLAPLGWEQVWFSKFAPTAKQLLQERTADEIDNLLRGYNQCYPPFDDFLEAIGQSNLDADEKELCLLTFQECATERKK